MKRRIYTLALTAALLLAVLPARAWASEAFAPVETYSDQFSDVTVSDWYYDAVKSLYELGLTRGKTSGSEFDPDGSLTGGEIVTMAARLRSLYETGDSEAGPAAYAGAGSWYLPYAAYLQSFGAFGTEMEGAYDRPVTRAEAAHVMACALPGELFSPVNRDTVLAGRSSGQYLQDVREDTPYWEDILRLYDWGIAGGAEGTGSFQPEEPISRCQAAAMVVRLACAERRLTLNWEILPAYSRKGTTMADLVFSDGTFYEDPAPDEREKIDADVRCMLSRGERTIRLQYPAKTVNKAFADNLTQAFLNAVRNYVEQTYNYVQVSYSTNAGYVHMTFASSLYPESQVDGYREATMDYALAVHDSLWESGALTADMTDYDKARVYFEWICGYCRYDHTSAGMSHTGWRVFAEKIAVCDGYTAAYNLLLKLEGIDCGSYSTEDHIWTVADLDGQIYHIDTTWGDQVSGVEYRYFAMTEADALARFE